jgi:GNAT superfamily N-acetyltransferase
MGGYEPVGAERTMAVPVLYARHGIREPGRSMGGELGASTLVAGFRWSPIATGDVDALVRADLSPSFGPFVAHFALEASRGGGAALGVREGAAWVGLLLTDPVERVASILTRSRPLAEAVVRRRRDWAVYSEFVFSAPRETYDVFAGAVPSPGAIPPFRHAVRRATERDFPAIFELTREVYGLANERWFHGLENVREAGFLVEVDGRTAGAGWLSWVPGHARLHSLAVRPPYRHIGIGTDLVFARLMWAGDVGARRVISEISERNETSRALASRAGMAPAGAVHLYPPG